MVKPRVLLPALAAIFFLSACDGKSSSPSVTLTIAPSTQSVTAGGAAVSFTATLAGSSDTVAWSLTGPGSIAPSQGTMTSYTPPATAASATTATLTASAGGQTATATINIAPNVVTLAVAPGPTQSVTAGGAAVNFTATLTGSSATITWSLTGPGSIAPSQGATTSYTPPATAATATTATLAASAAGQTATVTINIAPSPVTLAVAPGPNVTIDAGDPAVAFTATLTGSSATVTWSLTGPGTVAPSQGTTTSYTPPATVATPTSATLTASAAGQTATVTIVVNPVPTITISGPSIVAAGGAPVTYVANASGSTGTITWSLSGPGSISPATGIQTSYTPPATVAVDTRATLTASATGARSGTLEVVIKAPTTITVNGTVVDYNKQPVVNATVIISGRAPVITDPGGKFTVTSVATPYDCTAIWGAAGGTALVYQGLTRADPTLQFAPSGTATEKKASVSGRITPYTAGAENPMVAFGSPEMNLLEWNYQIGQPVASTGYDYTLTPSWYGASATTGTLHALQWNKAGGLPTTYVGYASQPNVTLSDGGTFSGRDLALTSVSTTSVNGDVSLFPNSTLGVKWINVHFKSGAQLPLLYHSNADLSFSYNTPNLSTNVAGFDVFAEAYLQPDQEVSRSVKRGVAANESNIGLVLNSPPVAVLPVDHATGVSYSTEFRWTPFSNGVHRLVITAPGNVPWFFVVTKSAFARIPDLSAYGMGLPAVYEYTWWVQAFAPFADVDAWAASAEQNYFTERYGESLDRKFITP